MDDESVRQSMLQSAPVACRGIIDSSNPTSETAGSSATIIEGLAAVVSRSVAAIQPRRKQVRLQIPRHVLLSEWLVLMAIGADCMKQMYPTSGADLTGDAPARLIRTS